jgi:serine/threonine protein kinase/tetratricopeptide (TPR) repeat protein
MEPELRRQAEKLFHEALARETGQRGAFLSDACDGDADLRREVDSLLAEMTTVAVSISAQPEVGTSVGPYRLEALIGAGGMGQVFRATDTRLQRTVAIKFLLPERTGGAAHKRRFIREAQAASALNHPNIVALYDISSHNGRDFLVMEHVSGATLSNLIGCGMPLDRLFHMGEQVASALAAAHEAGILHRDIKPANIMVTPGHHVKVLDFGIASILSSGAIDSDDQMLTATQLTTPGMVIGTVPYMPPEQARGAAVDARSDIFSLGCLLYEAATGQLPFRGPNALAVMHQILTANPARPGSLRADLPPAFDQLIAACLEKDPARRPASAFAVAQSLHVLCLERDHPRTSSGRRSIAVMPFRFRTAHPDDRFLSVALAEAVTNRLASSCQLVVRPVASVLRYEGTDVDWTEVARELNVDHVVEGTIQKVGAKLRVLVQAVRASDASPLHSSRHDGDMGDLFSLQDRIADSVSGAFLPGTKTDGEPAVPPTENPLAYELYLRAAERIVHMNKYDTDSAIEMLSRVVEIDPDFADAWGRLAQACSQMGMHLDPDPRWFDRAEHAIARTLELDPVQCDALCARGQILFSPSRGFQNLPALRAMNAALKINPGRYAYRQFRGAILFHLGFHEQADHDMQESLLANPGYALAIASRGLIADYRGDYAAAAEFYAHALAVAPALMHANIFAPANLLLMGRVSEANDSFRKARQMVPEESMLTCIEGLFAAHEGDFARAEALADKACSGDHKTLTHTHHTWHCAAGVYAICGKPEKAVAQVSRCLTMGLPNYRLFTTDPNLKSLHHDPAFTSVMTAMRREYDRVATVVAPAF